MKLALSEAQKAFDRESVPVGAVVVYNEKIIAAAGNEVEKNGLVTFHAEMLAITQASQKLQEKYLTECTMYVTLEPCAMCAQAISFARIKNLYFGAYDFKYGAIIHGCHVFQYSPHKPNVIGGILETECANIIRNFFNKKRQN
ncbi:MAG: nucleoside deaminase [Alphaproteobacteria bacterium]|nr:nucleoside deaminase [Alphaproteobacteria bacterium]